MYTSLPLDEQLMAQWLGANWSIPLSGLPCDATGQTLLPLQFDSRELKPGQIFWALKGEKFDAHSFVGQACQQGACGAVIDSTYTGDLPLSFPVLRVSDTYVALSALAHNWALTQPARRLALTGSNGKTTTKEMLRPILGTDGPVLATEKNDNNQFGVPFTLLRLRSEHKYAVIEIGTSGPGEIAPLAKMVQPDLALITLVGPSHLEGLGTLEDVYTEKTSIAQGLADDGILIINGEDQLLSRLLEQSLRFKLKSVGLKKGWLHPEKIEWNNEGQAKFFLHGQNYTLGVPGEHNVRNALLAIAAGLEWDLSPVQIAQGLHSFTGIQGRMSSLRAGSIEYINDAYNANPVSMSAALEVLSRKVTLSGRHLAFGDMLELGPRSADYHAELGKKIAHLGVQSFGAFGPQMRFAVDAAIAEGLPSAHVFHSEDHADLASWLAPRIKPAQVLLVKGSRGMRMEKVLEKLCP